MYDLTSFSGSDLSNCGNQLRRIAWSCSSMEEAAGKMVRHLYEQAADPKTSQKSCALVRFYKTHPYGGLDGELQAFVRRVLGHEPESHATKCLTLLGTVGDRAEWNSRRSSVGHKAIPLPSEDFVTRLPMIARLINQFGVELSVVLKPAPAILLDLAEKRYSAFHVLEAVGSPYIPAQEDFVLPHGIRSVLGFGGILTGGDLFAVILFAKVQLPRQTADLFESLGLVVREAVAPFGGRAVFA